MKYIVATHNGKTVAVLFPNEIVHRSIGTGVRESAMREARVWENSFLGAGFFEVEDGRVHVWGQSESMHGLKSRPEDAAIIAQQLGLGVKA